MTDTIVHQGWATKSGGRAKTWKKRFFVLRENGSLLYYEKPNSPSPKGALDLHRASEVVPSADCKWGSAYQVPPNIALERRLEVVTSERRFPLYCDTPEEAVVWHSKLSEVFAAIHSAGEAVEDLATADASTEVFAGWATKSGGQNKTWHRRHFVLRADGTLSYYTKITNAFPTGSIDLRHCTEIKSPKDCTWGPEYNAPKNVPVEQRFEVVTRERKFPIFCESAELAEEWVRRIKRVRDAVTTTEDKVGAFLDHLDAGEKPIADEEEPTEGAVATEPPATESSATTEPAAGEATAEDPAAGEATAKDPAAGETTAEDPAAEEATAEDPAAGETTAEEPSAAEQPATDTADATAVKPSDEDADRSSWVMVPDATSVAEAAKAAGLMPASDSAPDRTSVVSLDRLSMLGLPLEVAGDTVVHQGWATKSGGRVRTWHKRFFQLRGDGTMHYWASSDTQRESLGKIDLKAAKRLVGPGQDNGLTDWPRSASVGSRVAVVAENRTYGIFFDGPDDTEAWVERLILVCDILGLTHLCSSSRPDQSPQAAAETADQSPQAAAETAPLSSDPPAEEAAAQAAPAAADADAAAPPAKLPDDHATPPPSPGVRSSSDIIHCGWLMKLGAKVKSWKKRYFSLRSDGFLTYARGESGVAIGVIDMRQCVSLQDASECEPWLDAPSRMVPESRFEIITGDRTFKLFAETEETADTWMEHLSRACIFSGMLVNSDSLDDQDVDEVLVGEDDEDDEENESGEGDATESPASDLASAPSETDIEFYFQAFGTPRTKATRAILEEAAAIGRAKATLGAKRRHATIIYNPVSGAGRAKKVVETIVLPVLRLGGMEYTVMPTEHAGHCKEFIQALDLSTTDSIVVCGGDGMVSEGVTGFMNRDDWATASKLVPFGIVAVGTANAMAHELDGGRATSPLSLCGWAAVAVARGTSKPVDVVAVHSAKEATYGLSCIGWGLAGAVALRAEQLRWVPGQRKARYDIAGFVTITKDWPIECQCTLEYAAEKEGDESGPVKWETSKLRIINLIASNVAKLGEDHPISPDMQPDDGHMVLAVLAGPLSLKKTVKVALSMKQGKWLAENKHIKKIRTREFKISPEPGHEGSKLPYNIDGDPKAADPIHVKIMQKALHVHWNPPAGQ